MSFPGVPEHGHQEFGIEVQAVYFAAAAGIALIVPSTTGFKEPTKQDGSNDSGQPTGAARCCVGQVSVSVS